jgi:hypothetical protein
MRGKEGEEKEEAFVDNEWANRDSERKKRFVSQPK